MSSAAVKEKTPEPVTKPAYYRTLLNVTWKTDNGGMEWGTATIESTTADDLVDDAYLKRVITTSNTFSKELRALPIALYFTSQIVKSDKPLSASR